VRDSVAGHKSILAFGLMGGGEGVPVVAMLGRVRIQIFSMKIRFHEYFYWTR
jgi:hypothetical protein